MARYKLTIEYDGTGLAGWQKQENALSVQECLEEAIHKFSGEQARSFAAGRTDAGVHALGQVAHFDLHQKVFVPEVVKNAINHFLKPYRISVIHAEIADEQFHARFSAQKRCYRYIVANSDNLSVFERNLVWHVREELDINLMQQAANLLVGTHDFSSFRASECQGLSPIKTLDSITIERVNDKIIFVLSAKSFLHHMVRNIMGSLRLVGNKTWSVEHIKEVLAAKDRKLAGPTAPASGLYFIKVDY